MEDDRNDTVGHRVAFLETMSMEIIADNILCTVEIDPSRRNVSNVIYNTHGAKSICRILFLWTLFKKEEEKEFMIIS